MGKKQLTESEIEKIKIARWRARTDLGWLCREILGYKDVLPEVHDPVIDVLQKFPKPTRQQFEENDVWDGRTWRYKPIMPMGDLPSGRRVLILDPRGHLKTTINAQAHTIQWILNYPGIAMAIWQSNIDKGELILKEIKNHFQFNEKFRRLFPEHVPQKRIMDFGTKGEFTTLARPSSVVRRESTLMALSIDKGTAGLHFDVMKFSDIVEPENTKTQERTRAVIDSFYMAENLLVSPVFWIDVEGTRYTFADLYGALIKQWRAEKEKGLPHEYKIHVRSCYKKIMPDGKIQNKFTPDELELPYYKNEKGEFEPWFPLDHAGQPRFPFAHLESLRSKDAYIFSCQQENNPKGGIDGQEIFPVGGAFPIRITRENYRKNIRIYNRTMTIDTAETDGKRSNYSALIVVGWDNYGRAWVEKMVHGKFLPDELIKRIFDTYLAFKPSIIRIEETSFVRGLVAGLTREMEMRNLYLPLEFVKRENKIAKQERIQNSLQPYYQKGLIRFVLPHVDKDRPQFTDHEGVNAYRHMLEELKTFPLGDTDDLLDALADQFQNKEYFGPEGHGTAAMLGLEQKTRALWEDWLQITDPNDPYAYNSHPDPTSGIGQWGKTGGL